MLPAATVLLHLAEPNLRAPGVPRFAWRLHRDLSPKYEQWARQRLASARATQLSTQDIAGTEWPLFGSVFYLWATQALQEAWEQAPRLAPVAPQVYARGAIEAATQLVVDPAQANWVKLHWGGKYLTRQNVFYRMLVIAALTSHARLTGSRQYFSLLREQTDSLAAELDASPHGLLDDYPGECYPGDVLTAIAMIRRADRVLGTDHAEFAARALRGFQGPALDPRGLVPYAAFAPLGTPLGPSRGCGNSYVSLFAPELWPEAARQWYHLYAQYFWQQAWGCAGFREFPNDLTGNDWYFDVDSGPVVEGFGCAACAFGVGAARANGDFARAYPLTAELLVTAWPLPNGTCLIPRLLSNAADAPYLGEAAILFNLTREPAGGVTITRGGAIPGFVWAFLALQLGAGMLLTALPVRDLLRWRKQRNAMTVGAPVLQGGLWAGLWLAALVMFCAGRAEAALLPLLCAQFLPRAKPA